MHGQSETSRSPRIATTVLHFAAIGVAVAILFADGELSPRDGVLVAASTVYFIRVTLGLFVLLKRRFDWSEAAIVGSLFSGLHLLFAWLARDAGPLGPVDGLAVLLYGLGSVLNTGSELGRHRFKADPANRGKLYTGGLFRWSMHINYFGDSLLFSGFALLTTSAWAWAVPGLMTAGFVLQHIPTLDAYLIKRYGADFERYAARTKKFIPFVY